MEPNVLNIGFGSTVIAARVVAIVAPNSAPMIRLRNDAKEEKRLIDATHGRRLRSIILMDSNHVILSSLQPESVAKRFVALSDLKKQTRKDSDDDLE